MPVLDGYDTTRQVRRAEREGARTPSIAMTATPVALRETLARWLPATSV